MRDLYSFDWDGALKDTREYLITLQKNDQEWKDEKEGIYDDFSKELERVNNKEKQLKFLFSKKAGYNNTIDKLKLRRNNLGASYEQEKIDEIIIRLENRVQSGEFISENRMINDPVIKVEDTSSNYSEIPFEDPEYNFSSNTSALKVQDSDHVGLKKINSHASAEQIIEHFKPLSLINKSLCKPYLEKEDVELFIRNNFDAFDDPIRYKRFQLNINKRQKILVKYLVYKFSLDYSMGVQNQSIYANLLINNFEQFRDDKISSILSNFSDRPVDAENHPLLRFLFK